MVEIVSVIGAAWVICSVGSFEESYPHYIDRVYGTKADPLSDGNPGSVCCYDIAEYGPEGITLWAGRHYMLWAGRHYMLWAGRHCDVDRKVMAWKGVCV